MRLRNLRLQNIRCFEDAIFDLAEQGEGHPARFSILVGNNGTGKTTALRCIALALCDESDAAGLLSELYGDFVRNVSEPAIITVELQKTPRSKPISLTTTIRADKDKNYTLTRSSSLGRFDGDDLFICAYGAHRGIYGTRDYSEYAPVDAVYTLFNYETSLQSAELALRRRAGRSKRAETEVCNWLSHVLMLPKNAIALHSKGIVVSNQWDSYRPLQAVGDGYQATITWVLDFLGWALLAGKLTEGNCVKGIVLIDEIEQHLHPQWQRDIVSRLYNQFPEVQFITTSHSALCAAGLADLPAHDSFLGVLKFGAGAVTTTDLDPMLGWRYDQVLTSDAFGLPIARTPQTERLIDDLRKHRRDSAPYKAALKRLQQFSLSAAEDEEDRALRQKLASDMEKIEKLMTQKGKK